MARSLNINDEIIVAWGSFGQDGNENGIFAQKLTEDGEKKGEEFQVNTESVGNQYRPFIVANKHSYVILWQMWPHGGFAKVYALDNKNEHKQITTYQTLGVDLGDAVIKIHEQIKHIQESIELSMKQLSSMSEHIFNESEKIQ